MIEDRNEEEYEDKEFNPESLSFRYYNLLQNYDATKNVSIYLIYINLVILPSLVNDQTLEPRERPSNVREHHHLGIRREIRNQVQANTVSGYKRISKFTTHHLITSHFMKIILSIVILISLLSYLYISFFSSKQYINTNILNF